VIYAVISIRAHEAGINRSYISKLEKGASYPGLEIIAELATVLEVEPAELIRVAKRACE
jgi:transcriptional regulator with XRE-family HTH domain